MSIAVITGSSGLIGSETARFLHEKGLQIVGIDNNMRGYFFGEDGSTDWNTRQLQHDLKNYEHLSLDVRDDAAIGKLFRERGKEIVLVVHAAAQPSHDWAAREPFTDFTVNANGTLVMLEMTRQHCPAATFIFTSTNKVYGDLPNFLPLVERSTRWEVAETHPYYEHGIDESMSIDQSKHSLFGASKVAADVLTQEYGRYFELKTGTFRGGCLTGPAHSGAELHGFLAYLVKCALSGKPYTIYGYKGKQVRDNIHSLDVARFIQEFSQAPRVGEVYNLGGGKENSCSILEAFELTERFTGQAQKSVYLEENRSGDHICYYSDLRKMRAHYPKWDITKSLDETIAEIVASWRERQG